MRAFSSVDDVLRSKKWVEPDRFAREGVRTTLLPIDHADGRPAGQAGLAKSPDSLDRGASAGDHILDQTDLLTLRKLAFEAARGALLLLLLADDQKWEAASERGRRCERDRAQLGPRESRRPGRELARFRTDAGAELAQELRLGFEAVLVEVIGGAASRAQDEVPLEKRVLAKPPRELGVRHPLAAATTRRAMGRSFSPSGEPDAKETIEPSA